MGTGETRICPFLNPDSEGRDTVMCNEGTPYDIDGASCQAWSEELGDCKMFATTGLKVARGDRYKERWEKVCKYVERLRPSALVSGKSMAQELDRIQAEGED